MLQAVFDDEAAFRLAQRTGAPWVLLGSNLDILEAELDEETLNRLSRLVDGIAEAKTRWGRSRKVAREGGGRVKGWRARPAPPGNLAWALHGSPQVCAA